MQPNQIPSTPYPSQWQEEEIHLQDYLQILYRRRRTFLVTFVLVFVAVALYTFIVQPTYEAQATLHVRENKLKGGDLLGDLGLSQENPIETEIEVLRSRTNIEQVVERLHLNWQVEKKQANLDFSILEFTSEVEDPEYLIRLTGPENFEVEDSGGKVVASGHSGELLRGAGFSLLLKGLKGTAGDSFNLTLANFNETVRLLREAIKTSEVGKGTNIIQVSYQNTDSKLARDIVNLLTQVYLENAISLKSEEARKSVEFIESRLEEVRGSLNLAEQKLEDYKRTSGVIQLDSEVKILVERLAAAEKERNLLQLQLHQIEFAIESIQEALDRGEIYAPSVLLDDPVVSSLTESLAELEIEQRGLLAEVTATHPLAQKLQEQIDELERKLLDTFSSARQALVVQTTTLEKQLASGETKLSALPKAEQELARLTRLATVNASIYTFLLEKNQEARIAQAVTVSNINIVDPAIKPDRPVKPRKARNQLLGLIVGAMLGVGLAFFRDYLDDTIKDDDSAKRLLGLAILSTIPYIDSRKNTLPDPVKNKEQRVLISHLDPRSPAAEAFRSLRTSIHFASGKEKSQVVLVTSTFPGEGKTTVSANLAITLAQTGKKVLLIGCDLRKPTLHTMFDVPLAPGLTEYLIGDSGIEGVTHRTGHFKLDFINAGTTPPNPAELLGSEEMRYLIATERQHYDTILLDAPPVLAVTDAPVLAEMVDQVLTVVEVGGVKVKAAQRSIEILRSVDAPIVGLILNDKSGRGGDYYYSYYGKRYGNEYFSDFDDRANERRGWFRKFFGKG